MSDIFISYASGERVRAQRLATSLENEGWSVFWDRSISSGRTWRQVIEKELSEARCVLTLWCGASIKSRWVLDEAEYAFQRNKLIPALIENVQPPLGFQSIQAAHLMDWDGTAPTPAFRRLIADIRALIEPSPKKAGEEAGLVDVEPLVAAIGVHLAKEGAVTGNAPVVARVLLRVGARGASESLVNADADPDPAQPWPRKGHCRFFRKFDVAADPVFDLMVENTSGGPLLFLKTGIRILQREPLTGGVMGSPQPIKVQAEYSVHCREDWKRFNLNDNESWAVFQDPMWMYKDDFPFRFTLRLENFCDTDSASSSEIRFLLQTSSGMLESESIWLEQ